MPSNVGLCLCIVYSEVWVFMCIVFVVRYRSDVPMVLIRSDVPCGLTYRGSVIGLTYRVCLTCMLAFCCGSVALLLRCTVALFLCCSVVLFLRCFCCAVSTVPLRYCLFSYCFTSAFINY